MPQIRISELNPTSIGSGDVPIVQNGETMKYDITSKADASALSSLRSEFNNLSVKYIKEAQDINFTNVEVPLNGFLTNASKEIRFFIPWAKACAGTYSMKELSITVRKIDGGYPYARSGSSGGTYTQLGDGAVQIWNNGRTARTNEVSDITVTPVDGSGLRVNITFTYALAASSGSATAITNNVPISISKRSMTITRS